MISKFKFENYRICNIEFEINENYEDNEEEELNLDIGIGLNISRSNIDSKKVMVTLKISIFDKYIENKQPYRISTQMDGIFEVPYNMDDKSIDSFAKTSAVAVMFPYLRGAITQITSLSNCKPLVLPLINVSSYLCDNEKNS